MGIEETNKSQESNLSKLRASIQAQRELRNAQSQLAPENFPSAPKLELCVVPEITADNNVEFNLERHTQLCQKVDVLYHNYLVGKQNWKTNEDGFEKALRELCVCFDELLDEGLKVRWS
jgi:hypothetical protein